MLGALAMAALGSEQAELDTQVLVLYVKHTPQGPRKMHVTGMEVLTREGLRLVNAALADGIETALGGLPALASVPMRRRAVVVFACSSEDGASTMRIKPVGWDLAGVEPGMAAFRAKDCVLAMIRTERVYLIAAFFCDLRAHCTRARPVLRSARSAATGSRAGACATCCGRSRATERCTYARASLHARCCSRTRSKRRPPGLSRRVQRAAAAACTRFPRTLLTLREFVGKPRRAERQAASCHAKTYAPWPAPPPR